MCKACTVSAKILWKLCKRDLLSKLNRLKLKAYSKTMQKLLTVGVLFCRFQIKFGAVFLAVFSFKRFARKRKVFETQKCRQLTSFRSDFCGLHMREKDRGRWQGRPACISCRYQLVSQINIDRRLIYGQISSNWDQQGRFLPWLHK